VTWNINVENLGTGQQISILNSAAISTYPNPVKDQLHIKILEDQPVETYIELYDAQGRSVLKSEKLNSEYYSLDLSEFASGFYMLRVKQEDKQLSSRIIIKQ